MRVGQIIKEINNIERIRGELDDFLENSEKENGFADSTFGISTSEAKIFRRLLTEEIDKLETMEVIVK